MTARLFRTFAVTLVSLTLSYYGVAWATHCLHEEADLSDDVVLNNSALAYQDVAVDHSATYFECPRPAGLESLAMPSSQYRLVKSTDEIRLNFDDSLASRSKVGNEQSALWLRTVFDTFPIASPRYLFLSILRV